MADRPQHAAIPAVEAASSSDLRPAQPARPVAPRKERTAEQRAQRQALRATKLARKQHEAAARRQQRTAQAQAEQQLEEGRSEQPEADEDDESGRQLDGGGSAVHGNFHNYYAFNAVSERLQFLSPDFLQHVLHRTAPPPASPHPAPQPATPDDALQPHSLLPPCACPSSEWSLPAAFPPADRAADAVYVCDLGCNEGDLTVELVRRLSEAVMDGRPVVAVGVDIDGELIRRARQKSTQPGVDDFLRSPTQSPAGQPAASYLSFYHANLICSATFASLHSLRPPAQPSTGQHPPFHVVTCFSLLMWLHLCYGSAALCRFLASLCPLASHVVVELQGWRHYRSAVERRRRYVGCDVADVWHWADIEREWRGRAGPSQAVRERVVEALAAGGMREVAVLGRTKWGREVIWFARQQGIGSELA